VSRTRHTCGRGDSINSARQGHDCAMIHIGERANRKSGAQAVCDRRGCKDLMSCGLTKWSLGEAKRKASSGLQQRQLGTAWEEITSSADEPPHSKPGFASQSPRLRTVLAQFVHGRHLQDRLIGVSPYNRWTYRDVITVAVPRV
jgi:hypothetical protein